MTKTTTLLLCSALWLFGCSDDDDPHADAAISEQGVAGDMNGTDGPLEDDGAADDGSAVDSSAQDGPQSGNATTQAQAEAYCSTICAWVAECLPDEAAGCAQDCEPIKELLITGNIDGDVTAQTITCIGDLPCSENPFDACDIYPPAGTYENSDAFFMACIQREAECDDVPAEVNFHADLCHLGVNCTPEHKATMTQCLSKECSEVGPCLDALLPIPD